MCYQSTSALRITEGDVIYIGVYGEAETVRDFSLEVPTCSLESTDPRLLDAVGSITLERQAGGMMLRKFQPVECFDSLIDIKIRKEDKTLAWQKSLKQYQRYRGTFQIGTVMTELDDISYSTVDKGSGPVITADRDDSSGPQYVGSLVVYGFPLYIKSWFSDSHYSGRDIVNENDFSDRLGLVLSLGLDDPADTLGIGLSFEMATGINLTVTQLYHRLDVLDDGLSIGDSFTGSSIPIRKSWDDEVVWGISMDGRYLKKFFGSGK